MVEVLVVARAHLKEQLARFGTPRNAFREGRAFNELENEVVCGSGLLESINRAMFGWFKDARTLVSRLKRLRRSRSWANSSGSTLMATEEIRSRLRSGNNARVARAEAERRLCLRSNIESLHGGSGTRPSNAIQRRGFRRRAWHARGAP